MTGLTLSLSWLPLQRAGASPWGLGGAFRIQGIWATSEGGPAGRAQCGSGWEVGKPLHHFPTAWPQVRLLFASVSSSIKWGFGGPEDGPRKW